MKKIKNNKKLVIGLLIFFFIVVPILSSLFSEDSDISSKTASESTTQVKKEKATKSDNTKVASGSYDIDNVNIIFSDSVRNDVTGNWRLAKTSDSVDINDYVIDYYKKMFSSDDEIHAIIDFSLKTTTKVSVITEDSLSVTTFEYVKGEEHDANALFSGMVLSDEIVNISTGEVEEIQ